MMKQGTSESPTSPASAKPPSQRLDLGDIKSPKLLYLKGVLFLILGLLAAAGIILMHPSLKVAALLAITIWAFCRAYYFAFYVIQHYIDPGYRFAGLIDFVKYVCRKKEP